MQSFYPANSSRVRLDDYICDLNLEVAPGGYTCQPLSSDGFSYMWGGCKATYGIRSGKACYEVKVVGYCDVANKDMDSFVSRIGWSTDSATLQLGEDKNSFGFGGTGKKSVDRKFANYGRRFEKGDVVGCYLAMENGWVDISYSVNGRYCGSAFKIRWMTDEALFPHILVKNCKVEVNFGQAPHPYFSLQPGFKLIDHIPPEFRIPAVRPPASQSDCEVIMMVGLPGVGKTTWSMNYAKIHPSKKYVLLGTDSIIDKMRVMGLPRKNNFGGRWDVLIKQASDCFNILLKKASNLPRNLILDQTNVYASARRRKVKQYREKGYTINAMVLVPRDEDMVRRSQQRTIEEGKEVPQSAVLDMKANYSLPEENEHLFDNITFLELQRQEAQLLVEQYNMEAMNKGHQSNQQKGHGGNLNQAERNQSNRFSSNQTMYSQDNHSRAPGNAPARPDDKYSGYSGNQSFASKWEEGFTGSQKRPESSDYGPPEKYRRSDSPGRMGYSGRGYSESQPHTASDPRQNSYNQSSNPVDSKTWDLKAPTQDLASRGSAHPQAFKSEATHSLDRSMPSPMPMPGHRSDPSIPTAQRGNMYPPTSRNQSYYEDVKTETTSYNLDSYPSQRGSETRPAQNTSYYDETSKQDAWAKNSDVQYGGTMDVDQGGYNSRPQGAYGSGGNGYQKQPVNSYGSQSVKPDPESWKNQSDVNYHSSKDGNSYNPNNQGFKQQDNYYPDSGQYNAPKPEVKQEWNSNYNQPFPGQYENDQHYRQANQPNEAPRNVPGFQEYPERSSASQSRYEASSSQEKEQSYHVQQSDVHPRGRLENMNEGYGQTNYESSFGNRGPYQPSADTKGMQQDYSRINMQKAPPPVFGAQPDVQRSYGRSNQSDSYMGQNKPNMPHPVPQPNQPSVPANQNTEFYHDRNGAYGRPMPTENKGPRQSGSMSSRNNEFNKSAQGDRSWDSSYHPTMDSRQNEPSYPVPNSDRQPSFRHEDVSQHDASYDNRYNRSGGPRQEEQSLESSNRGNLYGSSSSAYDKTLADDKKKSEYFDQRKAQSTQRGSEMYNVDNQSSRDTRRSDYPMSSQGGDQHPEQRREKRPLHDARGRSPRDDSRSRNREGADSPYRFSRRGNSASRREERDNSRSRGSDRGRFRESDRREDNSRSRRDDGNRRRDDSKKSESDRRDDRDRRESSRSRKDDRRSKEDTKLRTDDKRLSGDGKDSSHKPVSNFNRMSAKGDASKINEPERRSHSKDRKSEPSRRDRESLQSSAPLKHEKPPPLLSSDQQGRRPPSPSQRSLLPPPKITHASPSDRAGLSNSLVKTVPEADAISKLASVDFDKLKASLASIRRQKLQVEGVQPEEDDSVHQSYNIEPEHTHMEEIQTGFKEPGIGHPPMHPRIPFGPRVRRPMRMPMRGGIGVGLPGPRGMRPRMPGDVRFSNDVPRFRPFLGDQQRHFERPRRALLETPTFEPEVHHNEEESYEDEGAGFSHEDNQTEFHGENFPLQHPRPRLMRPLLRGPRPMGMRRMMVPGRLRPAGMRPRMRPPGMRGMVRPLFPHGVPRRALAPRPGYM